MKTFTGIYIVGGAVRRMTLEAESIEEAKTIAASWDVGIEGESNAVAGPAPIPEAYDEETARMLLGKISRTSLYRMLVRGDVERLPGTRSVIVTRKSIEQFCRLHRN
jgi:hypothetical protein